MKISLGLMAVVAVCATSAAAAVSPAHLNSEIDKLFDKWNRIASPGAVLVVVRDGAVVYEHGYGYANLEHRVPATTKTVFDAASVAKQFTGLAIAMLIEQGKLSLEDPIRKHLPDLPDFAAPITIGHLLYHTSGLRDWPETLAVAGTDFAAPISVARILEMVQRQRELDFPPGQDYSYSNTGYNLLATILEKVTGKTFRAWTDANLFGPLRMPDTHFGDVPAEVIQGKADSYAPLGKGRFERVPSQLAAVGSSSLFITAEDMGRWLLNFETGRVGGKGALEAMHRPGTLNSGKSVGYGFGLALGNHRGLKTATHSGSWAGYRSVVMRIPERRFAVAILSNAGDMDPERLARKIADLCLGLPTEKAPSRPPTKAPGGFKPDPSSWTDYPGTYRLRPGWLLTISQTGDHLTVQASRESAFPMKATSDTAFFVEAYGAPVEFLRGSNGVSHLSYRGIRAPRIEPPQLTREQLLAYTGDYWSEELQTMVRLQLRDNRLCTWHPVGGWIGLIPTATDQFDTDAGQTVEFSRDTKAASTTLRLSGSRVRNLRFDRIR